MRWFWLDRFTEFVGGSHAVSLKSVSLSEPHMHDHIPLYPVMPHSLIAEGLAQTGGLLVSEYYEFQELVVLAKFSKCKFEGHVSAGETLTYRVKIENINEDGAIVSATAHVGERLQTTAEIFFARLSGSTDVKAGENAERDIPARLFDPLDLYRWLSVVGVFKVGVKKDGSKMVAADYDLQSA